MNPARATPQENIKLLELTWPRKTSASAKPSMPAKIPINNPCAVLLSLLFRPTLNERAKARKHSSQGISLGLIWAAKRLMAL